MPRKNFNPKNFELEIDHPWTMAIHTNDMVVLNPQLDLDHPDDLDTQTTISIGHIRKLLADINCDLTDVTNLRVSYVNKGDVDEDVYRQSIIDQMQELDGATIEMVPFDRLVLPELLVEICTYAMARQDGTKLARNKTWSDGTSVAQGVKCGNMIYVGEQLARDENGAVLDPNDITAQCHTIIDRLERVLDGLLAELADVVRLNIFYDGSVGNEEWAACLDLLNARFGTHGLPALTAIPLPRLFPTGNKIMASAWAMRGADGRKLEKQYAGLTDDRRKAGPQMWRHAVACADMIFFGGQSSVKPDGSVSLAGDHIAQTKQAMSAIGALASEFGEKLQNIHKTNSYYVLNTVPEFNSNLQVRSDCFVKPGPGSVGLPLDALSAEGQLIEVEAILVKE